MHINTLYSHTDYYKFPFNCVQSTVSQSTQQRVSKPKVTSRWIADRQTHCTALADWIGWLGPKAKGACATGNRCHFKLLNIYIFQTDLSMHCIWSTTIESRTVEF